MADGISPDEPPPTNTRSSWWSFSHPKLALELENTGSVARDHLALERTFLAWLRTSVSLVSAGIAITQLFKIPELALLEPKPDDSHEAALIAALSHSSIFNDPIQQHRILERILTDPGSQAPPSWPLQKIGKPLGAAFIGLGILTLLLGTARFFRIQTQLTGGKFSPSRVEVSINALVSIGLLIATFGVVLGMRLTAFT